MTVSGQNFEVYQGDDKQVIITVKDASGIPENLTNYTAIWCMYDTTTNSVVIEKTTASGISIPTPSSGQLVIDLDKTDTSILDPKTYGHQCEVQDAVGNHSTVTTGFVKLIKSNTHPRFL